MRRYPVTLLAWLAFATGASAADPPRTGATAPQPRVRLQQSTTGTSVHVEQPRAPTPAPTTPVLMDKMVIPGTRLRASPSPAVPERRTTFSPLHGGPLLQHEVGSAIIEVGVWPWFDLFWQDAQFRSGKAQQLRLNFDFLRVRW